MNQDEEKISHLTLKKNDPKLYAAKDMGSLKITWKYKFYSY